jgi:hypothetical protein
VATVITAHTLNTDLKKDRQPANQPTNQRTKPNQTKPNQHLSLM